MTNSKDLLHKFIESVRGKDRSEVIILAEREATRAYRNSMFACDGLKHRSSDWCQYSEKLTQMIYFLRQAIKPIKQDTYPYNLFHSLQNGIDQKSMKIVGVSRKK
jgi:hypothetical protein